MYLSVRMRASDARGTHVSGAEAIAFTPKEAQELTTAYTMRALSHPRGKPVRVTVSVERIKGRPRRARALSVETHDCPSPPEAEDTVREILLSEGVSDRAIRAALKVIRAKRVMRGAAVVDSITGKRLDPDYDRGVRATLMGMEPGALALLKRRLSRRGINTQTVIEAVVLASKVASAPGIAAELCVSDDPGYTTGYVASTGLGYRRITNLKKRGSMSGGRVFFVKPGVSAERLIAYLEKTAVLVY